MGPAKFGAAICAILCIANIYSVNCYYDPYFAPHHSTIVHLFEWKWLDIAKECETFLGPNGFGGVQVSPPTENRIIPKRPWYERYQPISYKLITRSGNEKDFEEMCRRCNSVNVRIYVDIVFNHMSAKSGKGTGGSTCEVGEKWSYPGVPYSKEHFHKACRITNYQNANEVRYCALEDLPDLDQSQPYVQDKIVGVMNLCTEKGAAGFRVDAVKHIEPVDLQKIYGKLKNLNEKVFGKNKRPFIYQEVIDTGGEAITSKEYSHLGVVTEFKHSEKIGNLFRGHNQLCHMHNWGTGWSFLPSHESLVFIDNHDNQRDHGKDHILTHRDRAQYVMATAFMLAHPYGITQVMSSFKFSDFEQGPPQNAKEEIESPKIDKHTEQCNQDKWICEHRWAAIKHMVKFRNVVGFEPLANWWTKKYNQIAFSRGKRGFIAFNNENCEMNEKIFTSLPAGTYCDLISAPKNVIENNKCKGATVIVDKSGHAQIKTGKHTVVAIHVEAKLE